MALYQIGINNVGEFYSPHYLDSLLEKDLRALYDRWKQRTEEAGQTDETAKTPDRLLAGCAQDLFAAKGRAERATDAGSRYDYAHPVHVCIAEALGYPVDSTQWEYVGEKTAVPVLCRLERDEDRGKVYAVSLTALLALGKELYDKKRKGHFSWKDLTWSGLGLLAGYLVFVY